MRTLGAPLFLLFFSRPLQFPPGSMPSLYALDYPTRSRARMVVVGMPEPDDINNRCPCIPRAFTNRNRYSPPTNWST